MADHEFESTAGLGRLLQPAVDRTEQPEAQSTPALQREPVDQVTCRAGDASCATAHASTLNRATASQPARAERSLLQLQRQYGNRYVERVLALARENTEHTGVSPDVERAIDRERGGGQPLDSGVRRQMEPAFGADFSHVHVHTGTQADTLNRALSARAFTTGQDIFFRQSAYQPGTSAGRELLAHELTHVVQQDGEGVRRKLTVSQPGDVHEVEAERMAHAVMQREQQAGPSPSGTELAMQDEKKREEQLTMAQRDPANVQRQPEAVKNEEEEKKKHGLMTKTEPWLGRKAEEAEASL